MSNITKIISIPTENISEIVEIPKSTISKVDNGGIVIPPSLFDYTFDPSQSSIYFTYEDDYKKVVNTRQYNYQVARTSQTISPNTGKHYWEIVVANMNAYIFFGISFNTGVIVTDNPANWANVGWVTSHHNMSLLTAVEVAYDSDLGYAWWGLDGVFSGNPSTGEDPAVSNVSGIVRPFVSFWDNGAYCNFKSGQPIFTPPEGYFG